MIKKENLKNIGYYVALIILVFIFIAGLVSYGNASFNQFNHKARQSEAKVLLTQLYQLENNFFLDQKKYTSCLSNFIAEHEPLPNRKYYVGFNPGSANEVQCAQGSSILKANSKLSDFDYLPYFEKSNVKSNSFTAIAVGKFCESCDVDVWSINEKKELVNIQSGIRANYTWPIPLVSFLLIIVMVVVRIRKKRKYGAQ
ncbi:hypothetical protein K2P97_09270 [bacterium]|nr:hypothetical protein [bacterium]